MGLYYRIIPYTHHLLRTMVFNDAEELLYGVLRKDGKISHPRLPYAMFVEKVQGRKLHQPDLQTPRPKTSSYDIDRLAREAELQRGHGPASKSWFT